MENMLAVDKLRKEYPDFILQDVSFQIPMGTIMGFIGENGAGKSTTIKLILNCIHRDGGRVSLLGRSPEEIDDSLKEEIGVVFSELALPDSLNAAQAGKIMQGIYKNWDSQRYDELLERFALKKGQRLKAYSRGMKMKLAIAMALSHHARFLVLDEPTSGLDPVVRDEILDLFLEFIQDERHSILISSHIVGDLEKIADYITLIHQGRILLSEEKDRLLERYRILKGPAELFAGLPTKALIGYRENRFGAEALADRESLSEYAEHKKHAKDANGTNDSVLRSVTDGGLIPEAFSGTAVWERAGIEDIMLYFIRDSRARV